MLTPVYNIARSPLLPLVGLLALAVLIQRCATTSSEFDYVVATPDKEAVLTAFAGPPVPPEPCSFESLLEPPDTPVDAELLKLLESDTGRWKLRDCAALDSLCGLGSELADHGVQEGPAIWQSMCAHALRCHEQKRELSEIEARLETWSPPPILAPKSQWDESVARYGGHLDHHEPEIAALAQRRRALVAARDRDRCRYAADVARSLLRSGLALMAGDDRAPRFLVRELARADLGPDNLLARWTPATTAYATLQQAYVRYGKLVETGGFVELSATARGLRRHKRRRQIVRTLAERLAREGFLEVVPGGTGPLAFDRHVERALKAFQRMHHLSETGAVGPATLAALNRSASDKRAALGRALAVYRRAMAPYETTAVIVQMPAAFLEVVVNGELRRHEQVVLGRSLKDDEGLRSMATPNLDSTITAIIFNPVWHIPSSIAENEIEPALLKDPGYLARHNYRREVIGEDRVRYIQLPGPGNALGRVKFHFANSHDVYLHDTPQKSLFKRPRRQFSHGCVRVRHAIKVATLLLNRDQGFTWDQLRNLLRSGETAEYTLRTPIPVHLIYSTAAADSMGNLHFLPDLYGRE